MWFTFSHRYKIKSESLEIHPAANPRLHRDQHERPGAFISFREAQTSFRQKYRCDTQCCTDTNINRTFLLDHTCEHCTCYQLDTFPSAVSQHTPGTCLHWVSSGPSGFHIQTSEKQHLNQLTLPVSATFTLLLMLVSSIIAYRYRSELIWGWVRKDVPLWQESSRKSFFINLKLEVFSLCLNSIKLLARQTWLRGNQ